MKAKTGAFFVSPRKADAPLTELDAPLTEVGRRRSVILRGPRSYEYTT